LFQPVPNMSYDGEIVCNGVTFLNEYVTNDDSQKDENYPKPN